MIGMSLVDIPHQFMCFVRIGQLSHSKSNLLNHLLRGTHHETFFHRDCKNGGQKRYLSNGTIEAAWFQPNGKDSSEYKDLFCILNLRGDSTEYLNNADFMCSIASLNFLMIDVNGLKSGKYKSYISRCGKVDTKFVLCFVAGSLMQVSMRLIQECGASFERKKLYSVITNWKGGRLLNADEWKAEIKNVITKRLTENASKHKIHDDLALCIRETCSFLLDQDDVMCSKAFNRTQFLQISLNKFSPRERKSQMLPLQGKLWNNWCKLQKEKHRDSVASENMAEFTSHKNEEKHKIRVHQLELLQDNNSSRVIIEFCSFSQSCDDMKEIFLVLAWMKHCLNSCSNEIMPELRNEYVAAMNEHRQHLTQNNTYMTSKQKSEESGKNLIKASLGLEHIFRELGQAFEAVVECQNIDPSVHTYVDLTRNFLKLPKLMANFILNGLPFELLDGDTSVPPMIWIKAVFEEIQNLVGKEKKVFVVSVLGVQSSGKSTLLNTMFGLQFAVSAGRCTRGAYCQMIPVKRSSANFDYDYLLVIDTEGLRAPELMDNDRIHDNELATFVIGLGNVTIVNIKGENFTEMQSVLEIVVHAMLRIKLVRNGTDELNPSCLFIHHNVATNAEHKMKIGETKLLELLDRAARAAGEHERVNGIRTFKDIINYDDTLLSVYLPDLWQGDPPMAPVNCGYSESICNIKEILLGTMPQASMPISFRQFTVNMKKLWKSILYENFIFSFRNHEEVRGYLHLDGYCSELIRDFKKQQCQYASKLHQ